MAYDSCNPMKDRITDIGPRDYKEFLPPVIQRNFGKWLYHDILEPGVLMHVSENGRESLYGAGGWRTYYEHLPYP